MNRSDLQSIPGWHCVQEAQTDAPVRAGYTSDLLSDVMAHAPEDSVLITIQGHANTVAVATLAGIGAIVVCNGRPLPADMIAAARREGIALWSAQDNQFNASVKLHAHLNRDPEPAQE